ncbi:MAG: anthranilate phosphoribosyltransferase [Firmicutes bacterium]|nr:anthranilate phosphoribosyltransferase [Bacillota bacterium]
MIKEAIAKIVSGQDLTYDEAYAVVNEIMSGETTQTMNAAFLAALSTKSDVAETADEIAGCAAAMREHALPVNYDGDVLEIVGTGGDGAGSFNISTTSSFVIAAAGVKVAKHGNRAASSKCGAADCLEALGAKIDIEPEKARELLDKIGFCFLFAQKYHTSMKYVGAIRRELGIRTVFNILGPLANPANPTYHLLGVYDESLVEPMARVLTSLGVRRGMVVYGLDKLDELSVSSPTKVCDFGDGKYNAYIVTPEELGLSRYDKSELVGGTPEKNAEITRSVLKGEHGAKRDAVLINSGAAIYIAGKAESIKDGVTLAAKLIDSGAAYEKLENFIRMSNE